MFLSVVAAMLLNTTEQMLFSAPKKSGTASNVQKVLWFPLGPCVAFRAKTQCPKITACAASHPDGFSQYETAGVCVW